MLPWTFWTYVSETGRNEVQKSIDRYDAYATASFERAVSHLAITDIKGWDEPHAKKLKNQEPPLYEIRYKANNRQERALGFFDGHGAFVITLICFHKGRIYNPRDAFEIAQRRAIRIKEGIATTAPLQINGEDFC
ncbi:type II toxin-antitoxin system RelE/ParE family toxin [Hydrogenophaga sp.]|uniref:type II toxin-antitoxin system RelE/ParE family toxin n=1 Tax=Hydrogenophaga sp. TaxID=1904254 RepID=UPI00351E17EF